MDAPRPTTSTRWVFNLAFTRTIDCGTKCVADPASHTIYCTTEPLIGGAELHATLFAIDTIDGHQKWSAFPGPIAGGPVIGPDRVYVASTAGVVSAFDLTGTPLWSLALANGVQLAPALTHAGSAQRLVLVDDAGTLRQVLDLGSGAAEVTPIVAAPGAHYTSAPVVSATDQAFVGRSDGSVEQVDLDVGFHIGAETIAAGGTVEGVVLDLVGETCPARLVVTAAAAGGAAGEASRVLVPLGP